VDFSQKLRIASINDNETCCYTFCQGVVGLALERFKLLRQAGLPFEPLHVLAPSMIKSWYNTVNSDVIPLNSAIR